MHQEKWASLAAGPSLLGKENITTNATEVDPGIDHLERASSGRPFVLFSS
jgi:hypothetical protein